MIDPTTVPDPGLPLADGYFLLLARDRMQALHIRSAEEFKERFGIDLYSLNKFQLLYVLDPVQAEREVRLNELYRAGMRKQPTGEGRAS
jgi:hypothetical protein